MGFLLEFLISSHFFPWCMINFANITVLGFILHTSLYANKTTMSDTSLRTLGCLVFLFLFNTSYASVLEIETITMVFLVSTLAVLFELFGPDMNMGRLRLWLAFLLMSELIYFTPFDEFNGFVYTQAFTIFPFLNAVTFEEFVLDICLIVFCVYVCIGIFLVRKLKKKPKKPWFTFYCVWFSAPQAKNRSQLF